MRVSVDLDDDVAAAVDQLCRERSLGLSEAVNELIRTGLRPRQRRRAFRQRSQALGLVIDVADVADALEELDGPGSR